jgi:choline dehydrogenase-like flavoprotein
MRVIVIEAGPGDQAGDFDQHEVMGMQRLYLDQGTTASRDLGVSILAGSCIGGGTTVNWQTSLRLPKYVRAEWAECSGVEAFTNGGFEGALDRVASRVHVGTGESLRNANNAPLERGCAALGYRWQDIPRNARGCDFEQCGFCVFGCRVGGKQSTATTYLADAQRAGDARIVAGCRALRIRNEGGRVVGVDAEARVGETSHRVFVKAPLVVAACGAIETPALLLRSCIAHPELGRNLFLHPTTAVAGRYEDRIAGWLGAPQTVLCDELDRVRGNYGIRLECAPIHPGLIALAQPWYGARDHRARMQHAAHVSAFIVITRDARGGRVRVDGEGRAVVDYTIGGQERALLQQGIVAAARVHWAAGASEIHTLHSHDHTFRRASSHRSADFDAYVANIGGAPVHANRCMVFSAHQMGTCRMGTRARESVCDERGAVRGVAGLYVADASLFPASSGVNPMITVMALAQLVGDGVAERGA